MIFARIFGAILVLQLAQLAQQAPPKCDGDCLEIKIEDILKKIKALDIKVEQLGDGLTGLDELACERERARKNGQRRHLSSHFMESESQAHHHKQSARGASGQHMCTPQLSQICQAPGLSEIQLDDANIAHFQILCDSDRWVVVMQRFNGSVAFHNQTWAAYKEGFGNMRPDGEFFLGLQHLHELTFAGFFELRIDLEDFEGTKKYAHYSDFSIFHEQGFYKLGLLGVYHGTAGDSFMYHEGQPFSTIDRDNDAKAQGSCSEEFNSAGWFRSCMENNMMGSYLNGENDKFREGMYWETFRGPLYSLKSVKMSIRAKCIHAE